jgi:hypothetical protein
MTMKRLSIIAIFLATSLATAAALACGAPFGAGVNLDPQQDIIVSYKNGIETYVFQPRFCGAVKDFGLVLPIPDKLSAVPKLTGAAAFAQVDAMSQPEEIYRTVCRGKGIPDAGLSNGGGATEGTTVVSQGKVGFLDYAQLKADSEAAITDWLKANGYPYDTQAAETFTYYVQKGWYFLAFRISTGVVGTASVCKDLGPVMLSFPSVVPVVPSRMAGARARDTSGSLGYGSGFSWRIFGITPGDTQVEFDVGGVMYRDFGYSGLVSAANVEALSELAVEGDRLTKLTIGFSYGSVEADVALRVGPGKDYRAQRLHDTYVDCRDGGIDTASELEKKEGQGCSFFERTPSQGMAWVLLAVCLFLLGRHRARRNGS